MNLNREQTSLDLIDQSPVPWWAETLVIVGGLAVIVGCVAWLTWAVATI